VMVLMATAGFDITRALITWQEVDDAAEWAAMSAQSLAVNPGTPGSTPTTTLSPQQVTLAMTTIYGSIPQIFNGLWSGKYAIVMSGVQWYTIGGVYNPYLAWTTTLYQQAPSETTAQWDGTFLRACSTATQPVLPQVTTVPDNVTVLQSVPTQNISTASTFLVVDIHYHFVPILPGLDYLTGPIDFYTSFAFPNLIGPNTQVLTFDGGNLNDGWNCMVPQNT